MVVISDGGLGDAIAHILCNEFPAPMEFVAVKDTFGESGTPEQLMVKYGLESINIVHAVDKVLSRKKTEVNY